MPIIEQTKTVFTCSDETEYTNKVDAEVHEGQLGVRAVAQKHGYSADSFSRDFFADLLIEHAVEIHAALDPYVCALTKKRLASATGGQGAISAAMIGTRESNGLR